MRATNIINKFNIGEIPWTVYDGKPTRLRAPIEAIIRPGAGPHLAYHAGMSIYSEFSLFKTKRQAQEKIAARKRKTKCKQ